MAEPGLGEIASIGGNPAIGAGTAGVSGNLAQLPADYQGVQVIQNAALAKAQANKYALEMYQKNLENNLKSFNELDISGIMENDYKSIMPEYVSLIKDLSNNYDIVANPMLNRERWEQLKAKEAALRGKIAASKQDLLMRNEAVNFLKQHKGFNTPESLSKIRKFNDSELGVRDPSDVIDFVPAYDLKQKEISELANAAALQKTIEQETTGKFITKTERTQYQEQAYKDAVRAMLKSTDEYDRPILDAVGRQFNSLTPEAKARYQRPDGTYDVEQYAIDNVYLPLKNQNSSSETADENQFALNEQQHKLRMREIAQQAAEQRRNFEFQKKFDDKDWDNLGAEIAVRQRSVFGAPDMQNAQIERIPPTTAKDNSKIYENIGQFQSSYGLSKETSTPKQGVPVALDAWLMNAYSIPGKTRKVYDEETGKEIERDNYLRPDRAWVTNEQDPNARKVIIRYNDEETGTSKDLVLPYAEHFQVLNNIAGEKNAIKLGGAKSRLMKQLTGKVNPSYEELGNVPQLANPNSMGSANAGATPSLPVGVSASPVQSTVPTNASTGQFILNADEYLKQKNKKK